MVKGYNIRAEFKENRYQDFVVGAESLEDARAKAELKLKQGGYYTDKLEWRGQVVFVGREP